MLDLVHCPFSPLFFSVLQATESWVGPGNESHETTSAHPALSFVLGLLGPCSFCSAVSAVQCTLSFLVLCSLSPPLFAEFLRVTSRTKGVRVNLLEPPPACRPGIPLIITFCRQCSSQLVTPFKSFI